MKVIDANMYWLPEMLFTAPRLLERFLELVPRYYGSNGYADKNEQSGLVQIVLEKPSGYPGLNYMQGEYRLERQLEDMDAAGIDKAVLKIPGCHEWIDLEMCKLFNSEMAKHTRASGGRLKALAVLPPHGSEACLKELEHCVKEYGVGGVQMCAHYGTLYLDDPSFAPYFERLNELGMTVYIHHTPVPVQYDSIYEYNNLRRSYGRCVDQMTSLGRMLFNGFFEKYPRLRCVYSMLGGGFYAYAGLMTPHSPAKNDTVARFDSSDNGMTKTLRDNVFFEMSHAQPWGRQQLECAVKVLGAEHIIFGSSYPVRGEWFTQGADFIDSLDLAKESKQKILAGNAETLYGV